MKLLIIWDLHWKDIWKKLIQENTFDKVIFLWDYVDSFNVSDTDMLNNLKDIIEYKKQNLDKVILLLWNHDVQYMYQMSGCSWYRPKMNLSFKHLFQTNKELFKFTHKEWNYLFSHAWFTIWWLNYFEWKTWINLTKDFEQINEIEDKKILEVLFVVWKSRWWTNTYWGPTWSWKEEMIRWWYTKDWLIQIVWHSATRTIEDYEHVIFCDNLEHWDKKPLTLTI